MKINVIAGELGDFENYELIPESEEDRNQLADELAAEAEEEAYMDAAILDHLYIWD